jgi:hypothetical protein
MASTTFIDQQTIIYAAWLNDANNAVYNGIFAASSISPANLVCNGSVSGTGFTNLVNNGLSAPGPIGSATPNTGAFTTLSASSLTLTTKLAVAQGGTGLATLTANNVILGNGTSTPSFVAPGTSGNVLTSNGTTWTSSTPIPAFGAIGSYAFVAINTSGTAYPVSGDSYSAGTGSNEIQSAIISNQPAGGAFNYILTNNLNGTWRWMGGSNGATGSSYQFGIAVRIS